MYSVCMTVSLCSQVLSKEGVSPDILVDRHYPTPALIKTIQHGLYQFTEELLKRGATVREKGREGGREGGGENGKGRAREGGGREGYWQHVVSMCRQSGNVCI